MHVDYKKCDIIPMTMNIPSKFQKFAYLLVIYKQ